ncbi:MAG: hypothetical protein PHO66_01635 [Eubacteriales bacterium]|nr:hypothetical protein [Eubacteriales bacterium]
MLDSYAQLCAAIDELGFLFLSDPGIAGVPALTGMTQGDCWHTGDAATDPWCWKNRYAGEKRGAYGALLGKAQGFVAPGLYASFYALRHRAAPREELYRKGQLPAAEELVWRAVEQFGLLDTAALHRLAKEGGISPSRCDTAIKSLQNRFVIALSGSTRRRNARGEAYGWSIGVYEPAWVWMEPFLADIPHKDQALANILDAARRQCAALTDKEWMKLLDLRV